MPNARPIATIVAPITEPSAIPALPSVAPEIPTAEVLGIEPDERDRDQEPRDP